MADGCVREDKRVSSSGKSYIVYIIKITSNDLNYLVNWHYALESKNIIHRYTNMWGNFYDESKHCSLKMFKDLDKLGVAPRKSLTLEFPENKVPQYLLNHFVRGYFDGDGSVGIMDKEAGSPQIVISFCGTFNFLNRLKDIFESKVKIQLSRSIHQMTMGGNKKVLKILRWLYKDSTIFLPRKKEVYTNHINILKNTTAKLSKETLEEINAY